MTLGPTKITGRLGMNFVERVALQAGCKPIQVPEDLDTGIDGLIEFKETVGITKVVAFQVKRGPSFFDKRGAKHQADSRHLNYWKGYALPVILIVIREDESEAFWMDVRQYARENPSVLSRESFVLRPPAGHRFDAASLSGAIRESAQYSDFGDAVSALTDPADTQRASALSLLYRFRTERRALFCLAAAIRGERAPHVLVAFCDFFSRYFPHPEVSFGVEKELSEYAAELLRELSREQVLHILAAFDFGEPNGEWDGAVEIYGCSDDEVWPRQDVIERGTVQQGIALVVGVAVTPKELLAVIADHHVPLRHRKSAVALFGYLGYRCPVETIDDISADVSDPPFRALLTWLRHWLVVES